MGLLDKLFGNKVTIVTATTLRSYMEFEQEFLFHKNESEKTIRDFLWQEKHYSIKKIERKRTKNLISPVKTKYRVLTKEKCIQMFD